MEPRVWILTAATVSTLKVMAQLLSQAGSTIFLAIYEFLLQAQKLSMTLKTPYLQILVLTDDICLGVSSFAKRQKISYLISFLLLHYLLCFSRQYTIYTFASKISSLITLLGGMRKETKEQAAVQTILFFTLSNCLWRDGAQYIL